MEPEKPFVIKRDGKPQEMDFNQVLERIRSMCEKKPKLNNVDYTKVAAKVVSSITSGITTRELDQKAMNDCSSLITEHPNYGVLAGRLAVSNLHKETSWSFVETMEKLASWVNPETGKEANILSPEYLKWVRTYGKKLDSLIDHDRDFFMDYLGFKTLERSYLLKVGNKIVERPQYMFLRVALAIHLGDWKGVMNTYEMMSKRKATHATPTLYSAGTRAQNYISCFLLAMKEDSLEGIYDTLKRCALISKSAGGIGLNVDVIRCFGSYIASTGGRSNGLAPMLRNYNETARYVDQCFPGDTKVATEIGFLPIESIREGVSVATHEGRFRKVTKVLKYDSKQIPMLEISTDKKSVTVTEEHPFLVVTNPLESVTYEETIRHLKLGIARFEWKDARDLLEGDFLVLPDLKLLDLLDLDIRDQRVWDKHFLTKVVSKRSFVPEKPLTLYDLEVEEDHSYVTEISIVHNGGGKRKGSFAIYLQPWHADIYDFLDLKRDDGNPDLKAKDLFYALWVPDLFMKRVIEALTPPPETDDNSKPPPPTVMWSLFSNHSCPGLHDTWGAEFEELYHKYEREKKYVKQVPVLDLWYKILDTDFHTGSPYILFKDQCNRLSNQNNLGTITNSNLCVSGDTLILTKKSGHQPIRDFAGREIEVWNGFEWSNVQVKQTGKEKKLLRVQLSDGRHVDCTEYHKFFIATKHNSKSDPLDPESVKVMEAKDLKVGMKLPKYGLPSTKGKHSRSTISKPIDSRGTIGSITELPGTHDTFCFNEPKRHSAVFNGVLTGNCSEIVEYSSPDEVSCCLLASISLPYFYKNGEFDFKELGEVVEQLTINLNKIIDINDYPIPEAKLSNNRHRPLGIGVQGLANLFMMIKLPWSSPIAKKLNADISECIYFHFLKMSNEIAKTEGTYPSYLENGGCALSHGIFQFELFDKNNVKASEWLEKVETTRRLHLSPHYAKDFANAKTEPLKADVSKFPWRMDKVELSGRHDWEGLRASILKFGVRNSLGVAYMPTASTSQILGNNEGIEPADSNLFRRELLSGEFVVFVPQVPEYLESVGLWSKEMSNLIRSLDGSVQDIEEIPKEMRDVFKTATEIELEDMLDMSQRRNMFTDQSQSFSCFMMTSNEKQQQDNSSEDDSEQENDDEDDQDTEDEVDSKVGSKRKKEEKPAKEKPKKVKPNQQPTFSTTLKKRGESATLTDLSNYLISGFLRGLKTGMYYLRLRTSQPKKFTLRKVQRKIIVPAPKKNQVMEMDPATIVACPRNTTGKPTCESCMG